MVKEFLPTCCVQCAQLKLQAPPTPGLERLLHADLSTQGGKVSIDF